MYPFYFIDEIVKGTNWYQNQIPNLKNYPDIITIKSHPELLADVVNLGSSSAVFGFDYEGIGIHAYNWALYPQSMEYSLKILKHYSYAIKPGGFVILPFSPFSGLSVQGKWPETSNDRYYYILNRDEIDCYQSVERRMKYPFRYNPQTALKRLVKDIPLQSMYSYKLQCHTNEEYVYSAERWISCWKKEFNILDLNLPLNMDNQEGMKQRLATIQHFIHFCVTNSLKPVLVITPVHHTLAKYFTNEFCKNYIYALFNTIYKEQLIVKDYLLENEFASNSFYYDAFFMNKVGAQYFTKHLLSDLKLI